MSQQNNIAGPGQGLPYPNYTYPVSLTNGTNEFPNNEITLLGGQYYIIPAGSWMVAGSRVSVLQYMDPVTTTWRTVQASLWTPQRVTSDGFNFRVFNPTGCVVAAVVSNGGANYVQASTAATVTAANGITLYPIVGGQITAITTTVSSTGLTLAPITSVSYPSSPGVQCTAYFSLTSGGISVGTTATIVNAGAGYASAPTVALYANPSDPNYGASTLVVGSATATVSGTGKVTAVLVTNSGGPLTAIPAITITGGNASATATAVWCTTTQSLSTNTAGSGSFTAALITSSGGVVTATAAFNNPAIEMTNFIPRQLQASAVFSGGVMSGMTVSDPGLFFSTVNAIIVGTGGIISTTAPVATVTQGTLVDTFLCQQV